MRRPTRTLGSVAALLVVAATVTAAVPSSPEAAAVTPGRFVSGWIPNWSSAVVNDGVRGLNAGWDQVFTDVSPFGFSATAAGTIATSGSETSLSAAVAALRARNLPVLPSITDGTGKGVMAGIMTDPTTRTLHVQAITSLVMSRGYDGIDLDYEGFAFTDGRASWATTRPNWAAFVIELGASLHANGKLLSVTVPPIWDNGSSGYQVYSWHERTAGLDILPSVDRLRLMVYDWSVSQAGAVSPIGWVNNVLSYVRAVVPADQLRKVQMGVPTYGRSWARVITGTCPTSAPMVTVAVQMENMAGLLAKPGATSVRDASGEMKLVYDEVFTGTGTATPAPEYVPPANRANALAPADPSGLRTALRLGGATCTVRRTVYYPDVFTVVQHADAALNAGLSGIAIWALGYETDDIWPQLAGIDVDRPAGSAPYGSLDVASVAGGGVRVAGWALDPEFDLPITIRVSVTNPGQSAVTSGPIIARGTRSDVPVHVQYADPLHGFDTIVPTATSSGATVCVTATGYGAAASPVTIGCAVTA
jgi:hypothetical protein